jgi:hypothetical protein
MTPFWKNLHQVRSKSAEVVMSITFDIYVCITITGSIPLLTLSVPDEGSSRKASWTLNLISTFILLSLGRYLCWLSVPDEGSSRKASWALNMISTFALLSLGRYLCWLWVYLMKVLPERRHEHYIWYLPLYYYHWVNTSADFERTWWRFFFGRTFIRYAQSQQRYRPSDSNTNVDIKFSAHDAFLEEPSSGTLKVSRGIDPVIVIQR